MTPRNTILCGDAYERLRELEAASVDCVITSPPYYALRSYGVAGQIGLEPTVFAWVDALRRVMLQVARVLKPTGSVWLELGDSYSRGPRYGAPAKSLLLGPERLLLGLADDGWIVRNKVVYAKTNPMPHSVGDRLNSTYDVLYFLVRSRIYHYDLDSIREAHRSRRARGARAQPVRPAGWAGPLAGSNSGLLRARPSDVPGHWRGKNPGDVWQLPASNYRGPHFATFPEVLVERPLLATCPERICSTCAAPWRRRVTIRHQGVVASAGRDQHVRRYPRRWETSRRVGDLEAACGCGAPTVAGLALDPFAGSGTVGVVAAKHRRDWLGIELNPDYVALANARLAAANGGEPAAA